MLGEGTGGEGQRDKRILRCAMYMHQLPTVNVFMIYCKHVLNFKRCTYDRLSFPHEVL